MGSIWSKEPAIIIGAVFAVIVQVIGVLLNEGFLSDVVAGRLTDLANGASALIVALLPLFLAVLVRANVYSPATYDAK